MVTMKCFVFCVNEVKYLEKLRKLLHFFPVCGDKRIFQFLYLILFSIWKYCKSFKFFPVRGSKMDWWNIFQFLAIETKI